MKKTAFLASFALFPICSFADQTLISNSSSIYSDKTTSTFDDIVVTANRYAEHKLDTIADIVVVSKDKIEQMQAQSVADVVKQLPGVQISSSGGLMQKQSIFVRGLPTKYTLVLMDGVRLNSATTGEATISALPVTGVERIEFIRGPRAAVYGADAVAGVINIITEPNFEQLSKKEGSLEVTGGSNHYYRTALVVSGETTDAGIAQRIWGKLSVSSQGTQGYNVQPNSPYSADIDKDGGNSQQVVINLGAQLNQNWQVKLNGFYNKSYSKYDVGYLPFSIEETADQTDGDYYNFATIVQYKSKDYQSTLTVSTSQDRQDSYHDDSGVLYGNTTKRQEMNWFNYYQMNKKLALGAGIDWSYENVGHSVPSINNGIVVPYLIDDNRNIGTYVLAHYDVTEKFKIEGNIRHDDNQNYGGYNTWQLGAAYRFDKNFRITTTVGTAFVAPTFNDLYGPYGGNPDLKVEQSKNYELAFDGYNDWLTWRIAGYYNNVKNKIISDDNWILSNIAQARIKGIELSTSFVTGPLQHELTLNYTHAIDSDTGLQLLRVAEQSANWRVTYQWKQWQLGLDYLYQGKRYDNYYDSLTYTSSRIELKPYSLIDLTVSYEITDHFTIKAKVTNGLNEHYETEVGYATPERGYYLTMNYKF